MDQSLSVSVVLPTHGRRASLLRVLRSLGQQSLPPNTFEVVVICDGDVDGTAEACRLLTRELPYTCRVIEQSNQGPAAARNRGVVEAQAPLIVFIDDDVVPDEHLIATHLQAHEGNDLRVTIGPLLPPRDVRLNAWGTWEEHTLCRQYSSMAAGRWQASHRQFYTGNAAILKHHIVAAGGFDPSFRRAEDVELARRLHDRGLQFIFLPDARGWHYVHRTFDSWLRMPVAYGASEVAMARVGRPEILKVVVDEYQYRSWAVRLLTHLCVDRPSSAIAVWLLGLLVHGAAAIRATPLSNLACSLIFNLRYYDGFTQALGGRAEFDVLMHNRDVDTIMQHLATREEGPMAS